MPSSSTHPSHLPSSFSLSSQRIPPPKPKPNLKETKKEKVHRAHARGGDDVRDARAGGHGAVPARQGGRVGAVGYFEDDPEGISEFMTREAENKWRTRLLRKGTIEDALVEFNRQVDDAARAFQITALISIQLALGGRGRGQTQSDSLLRVSVSVDDGKAGDVEAEAAEFTSSPVSLTPSMSFTEVRQAEISEMDDISQRTLSDEFVLVSESVQAQEEHEQELFDSITRAVPAAELEPALEELLDHRGFRRYTQADVHLKGRTRLRSGPGKGGWWAGTSRARVDGRSVIVKTFEGARGEMMKKWVRDVKVLQNVYHPNLPQMVGYSDEETPTPFILLANFQMRLPQAMILDLVENASLASCAVALLRLYRDTLDAALYVQTQLGLDDNKTQDYVENTTYVIDGEGKVIMGLPPPEIANWVSWRNYGLAHSIREIYMRILPNRGNPSAPHEIVRDDSLELQQKISHLSVLIRALLPDDANATRLSAQLSDILDNDEDDTDLSLQQLRLTALSARPPLMWGGGTVPAFHYHIGDLGYIPEGKTLKEMCVVGNVVEEGLVRFDVVESATGWQGSWERGFRAKQDLQPFPAPFNAHGWAVVVPPATEQDVQVVHDTTLVSPAEGWRFLLQHGRSLAEKHGVKPEDLILGTDQQFKIRDFRFGAHNRPGFGHQAHTNMHQPHMHMNSFHAQQMQPRIFYLFTSPEKEHEPYWSETPVHLPLPAGTERPQLRSQCAPSVGWNHGYLSYVQLHREDFIVSPKRRLKSY
ncbi:hypothetical protein EIP91_007140 [Steccherinum ochraceum]|uniref:Protein kinase domain-containing protein n=1 Tax=Steccherinum ochraceum TaxID=92696 RepID=A0A4R0RIW7_9APHY|nr:hypothetical protein EIP91_007140 [Steccherinum ochraceum]